MATVASSTDIPLSCVKSTLRSPVTNFSPSMWAHTFSTFSLDDQEQETYAKAIEELKEEARSKLLAAKSSKLILLIDTLERLGLAYHFDTEIETKLQQIYNDEDEHEDYDLFTTALRFRLLRQHQYHVSCGVFDKFLGEDKKLDKDLISSDVEGLLSLYEAAHVRIHGEDVLEEAVTFTKDRLITNRLVTKLEHSLLRDKVEIALENPLHRSIPIFEAPRYISLYQRDETRDQLLLKLAKFNFNFLQNVYKKELCDLTRWWTKLDLMSKLPYARDRLIECYIWGVGTRYEPQYSYVRIGVTKVVALATIVDDTYDNYATLEQAQLFTDFVERWEMNELDGLPDCMKSVYRFVMSVYEDHEHESEKQDKSFSIPSFQETTILRPCKAYNQELKWVLGRKMPPFEEYLNNSVAISCLHSMLTSLVPGMKSATQETVDWVMSDPKMVILAAKIGRLLNDLATYQRESKEGNFLTVVDCYMEHYGVTKEEALSKFTEQIEDAWKGVNEECITMRGSMNIVPKQMVENVVNYMRLAEVTYKNRKDAFSSPEITTAPRIITSLFLDPILI